MVPCPATAPIVSGAVVTRFAPSPTGLLHLGHAFSAWRAWRRAREAGGRFLLRIEDLDPARCRPAFETAILEDLAWLGIDWDGAVRRQSDHLADYRAVLARLRADGLLYPCFCTRRQVAAEIAAAAGAPHGPSGAPYPGTCRALAPALRTARLAAGEAHAWRLDAAATGRRFPRLAWREEGRGRIAVAPLALGDAVLGRKDAPASYHLAACHDDHVQGVTLVVRGRDLMPSTHIHRLLQAALGWREPAYAHHPLLAGGDGRRLSKRDGAASIRALRQAGHAPADVLALARRMAASRPVGDR